MIPLGAFELQCRLGEGGMGEVWRGVHRAQHVPVAIKLLTTSLARKSTFRRAFRNEVRAVAGLDHPNIVLVFDYGTVDAATESASGGALRAGTPWLAMELAEDGSLDDVPVFGWTQLRALLLSLLDALSHAHARGVVHRDIKPGNVLMTSGSTVKLTDFGLAHAMDREDGSFVAGTPAYMAPEQFEARWREYGPWTDLYAVGCLAWSLCTGAPPFGMIASWEDGQHAHNLAPVPLLSPAFPVPDFFEAWLGRALSKDPRLRWRRAADAAWALLALPERIGPDTGPPTTLTRGGDTLRAGSDPFATVPAAAGMPDPGVLAVPLGSTRRLSTIPTADSPATETRVPPTRAATPTAAPPRPTLVTRDAPPLPQSWRRPQPPARSPRLVGAGLGLFGLRAIPMVGRRAEREVLWEALRRVHETGESHVVLVRGPEGCGKSRLGRWLSERAHEVGGADVLSAVVDGSDGRRIDSMFARFLRCNGLLHGEAEARVLTALAERGVVDPVARREAVDLLVVDGPSGPEVSSQRARLLANLHAGRPLVVVLDDAHRDPESLDLALGALEQHRAVPALVCITLRDEGGEHPRVISQRLAALRRHRRVRSMTLGPLAEEHRAELVRQVLGLEGPLAAEVERRTGGNPHFAVQLVSDWVRRGLLEPGRRGFRLKEGAVPDGPDDQRQAWAEQLDRVLGGRGTEDAIALELASLLGHDVDWVEWTDVCERAGLRAPGDLVDVLLAGDLAGCGADGPESGWRFAHGLLREVLEVRARQAGRLHDLHLHCAAILEGRGDRGVAERRAHHLLAAGRTEDALQPLLVAADERLVVGDLATANVLLGEREEALSAAGVSRDDVRHAEGWLRWGRLALLMGRYGDAEAWVSRAVEDARQARYGRVLVDGLLLRGRLARLRGDVSESWRLLYEAEQLAERGAATWRLGLVRAELGELYADRGELDKAADMLRQAREHLEAAEDPGGIADVFLSLASVARRAGRSGAASVLLDWARGRYRWLGCRLGLALVDLEAARLARAQHDPTGAADFVRDAIDDLRRLGSAQVTRAELELAILCAARGDLDLATRLATQAVRSWTVQGLRPIAAQAHALSLGLAALARDERGVARHHERVARLVEDLGMMDPDLVDLLADAEDALRRTDRADVAASIRTILGPEPASRVA